MFASDARARLVRTDLSCERPPEKRESSLAEGGFAIRERRTGKHTIRFSGTLEEYARSHRAQYAPTYSAWADRSSSSRVWCAVSPRGFREPLQWTTKTSLEFCRCRRKQSTTPRFALMF